MNYPDARKHLYISITKSCFRLIGCFGPMIGYMISIPADVSLLWLGLWLAGAEVLGIWEEIV